MATIAALAVAGIGMYTSSQSAKAGKKGLDAQLEEMRKIRAENIQTANKTYSEQSGLLDNLPSIDALWEDGQRYSDKSRKDLLDFTLGSSQEDLRGAQKTDAKIANFDFSNLNEGLSKILRSSQFNIAAVTNGEPIGSIANLSAANIFNFRQQGLTNSLQEGDFFARTAQTDRFNPYNMANDIYLKNAAVANSKIQLLGNRANSIIGSNNTFANQFADISNAQIANQANKWNGINNAIAAGVSTYTGVSSAQTSKQNANTSQSYYSALGSQVGG